MVSLFRIMKVKNEICPYLVTMLNTALKTGIVPVNWREANLIPIFMTSVLSKHQPVDLSSIVCKKLEGIVADRIVD